MSLFQVQRREKGLKPKQLREKGTIPMAFVERNHETIPIQAPSHELREAMRHTDGRGTLELDFDGHKRKAIVKSVDHDALKGELIHITLQEVSEDDQVRVDIPVVAVGHNDDADTNGIQVTAVTDVLKVKGKLKDIPEKIEVDISRLSVGEHISAGEAALPEGVELVSAADATLFTVSYIQEPDLEPATPSDVEAEVGVLGAEGGNVANPGDSGTGGVLPSGEGTTEA